MIYKELIFRPLAIFTLSFYALLCVFQNSSSAVCVCTMISCSVFLAVAVVFRIVKRKKSWIYKSTIRAVCALFAGLLLSSFVSFFAYNVYLPKLESQCNGEMYARGVVSEVLFSDMYQSCFVLKTDKLGNKDKSVKILVNTERPISSGLGICGIFDIHSLTEDYESLHASGVHLEAETDVIEAYSTDFDLETVAKKLNNNLTDVFYDTLGKRCGGLYSALFLGNKSYLESDLERDFQRVGILHLLALSGAHLSILCVFIRRFMWRMGRRMQDIVSSCVILLYMVLTGLSPSVCRSGIMIFSVFSANFSRRSADSYTNLGISAFVLSLLNPFVGADIGLQLSVCAMFAMLLAEKKERFVFTENTFLSRFVRRVHYELYISVAVVIFTLPLMWNYFGSFSALGPIATVLFTPVVTVMLWLSPFVLVLAPFGFLSNAISYAAKLVFDLFEKCVQFFADFDSAIIPLEGAFCIFVCIALSVAIVFLTVLKSNQKLVCGAVCLLLTAVVVINGVIVKGTTNDCAFINVTEEKKNEAVVVRSGGREWIFDVGNGYGNALYSAAEITNGGITHIEAIVLTHTHEAHTTAVRQMLGRRTVNELLVPAETDPTLVNAFSEMCDSFQVKLSLYSYGDIVKMGDAYGVVMPPKYLDRSTMPLVQINVYCNDKSFTYLGGDFTKTYVDFGDSDYVYLGVHGPKYKAIWDSAIFDNDQLVSVSSFASDFAPFAKIGEGEDIVLK